MALEYLSILLQFFECFPWAFEKAGVVPNGGVACGGYRCLDAERNAVVVQDGGHARVYLVSPRPELYGQRSLGVLLGFPPPHFIRGMGFVGLCFRWRCLWEGGG